MAGTHAYELPADGRPPADAVREAEGGQLVFLTRKGERVAAILPVDQAWYWTDEWQAGEREAEDDLARGRGTRFRSEDEFEAFLSAVPHGLQ